LRFYRRLAHLSGPTDLNRGARFRFVPTMDSDNLDEQHPQPSGSHEQQRPQNGDEQLDLVGGTFAVIESDPGQPNPALLECIS
jgi:hypothetical protein